MGPQGSSFSKVGIQVTDSVYVVLNMRHDDAHGKNRARSSRRLRRFHPLLHSKADLDMERRFICHYPQDNTIWSVGSGYGGNALLGEKMSRFAHRQQARSKRRLARRTYADRRRRKPRRRDHLRLRRVSERLRENESRHAGAAREHERLEDSYHWRRYFLVARGAGWPALGGQSGSRILRRRSRHRLQDQPERHGDD